MTDIQIDKNKISDRDKARELAIARIHKGYGATSIIKIGDRSAVEVETISTGSLALDLALEVGGLPVGRVIEIYGPESSGKTTLALHVIAECQKAGGTSTFIDVEHALDPVYARRIGVDINELYLNQPYNGEEALEIAEELVRSNSMDLIVIDSVAALTPKAEIEGEMVDQQVGLQARLMGKALRKITAALSATKSRSLVIFINQIRMKIGIMFGNPETTPGGNALKFYASIRLDIRKTGTIGDKDKLIGNSVKVKVVKSKVARPFQEANIEIIYGKGIRKEGELIDLGEKLGIIQRAGSWFSYENNKIGQGRENVIRYLLDHPVEMKKIERQIRDAHKDNRAIIYGENILNHGSADTDDSEKIDIYADTEKENDPEL